MSTPNINFPQPSAPPYEPVKPQDLTMSTAGTGYQTLENVPLSPVSNASGAAKPDDVELLHLQKMPDPSMRREDDKECCTQKDCDKVGKCLCEVCCTAPPGEMPLCGWILCGLCYCACQALGGK